MKLNGNGSHRLPLARDKPITATREISIMNRNLRVLHVEDSERDAELLTRHLSLAGYDLVSERVETAEAMKAALEAQEWNVILCDYSMPQFNALRALALAKEMEVDIPFIIISGTIGEPVAVEAMRSGAHDYLMKDNLIRLAPIIERELHEAENRRARRAAEEQLDLQSVAMESAANAIMITDEKGAIIWVNYAFTETSGYSKEEVLGRNPRFLKSGKQDQAFYQNMWDTILAGKIWHDTLINRRKDGTFNHEDMTITPIRDNSGKRTHFVAIKHDITEKTLAQEGLQASDLRYRRLFESAKDGILILDADSGQIVDVNPYLIGILGYSKEELVGKELWEIGVFKDIVASKVAFVELQQRGFIRYENMPLETRDGLIRQVEVVSNSYLAGEVRVIQCNIRDITDRKLAEEELRRTNERLEEALAQLLTRTQELASMTQQLWQASKLATMGELAASVAHELNNPLATLALHAEFLLKRLPGDDPKRRAVEVIEQEIERMATLVSNLLLFSRRSQAQISTIDIAEELQNSLELISYHLRTHNITLATDLARDLPAVLADRQQLRQVFLNLLTNASDAMPEGGRLTIRAHGVFDNGAPTLMVEFSDTGVGIKPEDLPRLWESFFTTKPEGKGTGLGLPICRRTIEEHRGTIGIESQPGKGTTVRIILPAVNGGVCKP
jgi:PAS domain S-box-containing protein